MNLFHARLPSAARRAPADCPAPVLDLAALMGAPAWSRLHPAVQRRFGTHVQPVRYEGLLDLRCSRLGRLLAWLSVPFRGPLVPQCATGVPVAVEVAPDGEGGVMWTRHLGRRTVRSVKQMHPDHGVLERTVGGLAMALDVLEDHGALVFQSRHYLWCLGPWRLRLPDWLSPGTCRVEHRDLGQGHFRFTLSMTHPRWGLTFEQTGVFEDPVQEN
ncbi:DUF4166 domain-containing protein [Roseateles terrae]|uniref:DUF4166 domain-containing protein n=1 Tax=Roseateles terrae TaxID=431060 RepID=A0ABR6GMA7_9BURK|nr:DUF4166 domain-containing protein [Roseateles terrae]MBB3192856.1 hypothetical protein [Roseateles terrae]OWQ89883.1 hypothetical protein CDN98_05115 [Roseateles terrae]